MREQPLDPSPPGKNPEWPPLKRRGPKRLGSPHPESQSEKGNDIWLLTLSDLLLLLTVFFVLLFGLTFQQQSLPALFPAPQPPLQGKSEGTSGKTGPDEGREFSARADLAPPGIAIRSAALEEAAAPAKKADPQPEGTGPESADSARQGMLASLEEDLREIAGGPEGKESVSLSRQANQLILTFPERIVFDPGRAELKPSAKPILDRIASLVSAHPYLLVEVQGHTDDRPIHTPRYPSNWELSVHRATQVVKALIGLGIDPAQISGRGFGEYRHLRPNDSEENRQKNRRVEIQISLAPHLDEFAKKESSPPAGEEKTQTRNSPIAVAKPASQTPDGSQAPSRIQVDPAARSL